MMQDFIKIVELLPHTMRSVEICPVYIEEFDSGWNFGTGKNFASFISPFQNVQIKRHGNDFAIKIYLEILFLLC